jgi:hypothetical protein
MNSAIELSLFMIVLTYGVLLAVRTVLVVMFKRCDFKREISDSQEKLLNTIFCPTVITIPVVELFMTVIDSTVLKYWKSLEEKDVQEEVRKENCLSDQVNDYLDKNEFPSYLNRSSHSDVLTFMLEKLKSKEV